MTRAILAPAQPHAPQSGGMSLRLFSLISCFLVSMIIWSVLLLVVSGCARKQPGCADCWIVLRDQEAGR